MCGILQGCNVEYGVGWGMPAWTQGYRGNWAGGKLERTIKRRAHSRHTSSINRSAHHHPKHASQISTYLSMPTSKVPPVHKGSLLTLDLHCCDGNETQHKAGHIPSPSFHFAPFSETPQATCPCCPIYEVNTRVRYWYKILTV